LSLEQARAYCIDCFFGSRAHLAKMYASARVPEGALENDVNGVGITYGKDEQVLAILLRRENRNSLPVA